MTKRGEYRPIYIVLVDSPEFQALSPWARLLWYTLKMSLGPAGIGVLYDDQLAERSGVPRPELSSARQELVSGRWLEVDGWVHWLRNGLKYEPTITVANPTHRTHIERILKGLPRCRIVLRFADYYGLTQPFELPPQPNPETPKGRDTDRDTPGDSDRDSDRDGHRDSDRDGHRDSSEDVENPWEPNNGGQSHEVDEGVSHRDRHRDTESPPPPPPRIPPPPLTTAEPAALRLAADWRSEVVGRWNGGDVLTAYLGYGRSQGWSDPPVPERSKQGAAGRRLSEKHAPATIVRAMIGMGNLYPHSKGEPWDLFDLEKKFTKAHAAAESDGRVQEARFDAAFLEAS